MDEYGTDLADAAVESVDIDLDTSSFDEQPADLREAADLVEAPAEDPPAGIEDALIAEDLGKAPADQLVDSPGDTEAEAPVDLTELVNAETATEADAPQDWSEGEVVDLGHDRDDAEPDSAVAIADSPNNGEDLNLPEYPHGDLADGGANPAQATIKAEDLSSAQVGSGSDATLSIEGPTNAAQAEARAADELRAEYDAAVDDLLSDDTPNQKVRAEQDEHAVADATEPATSSDQNDTTNLRNSPDDKALTAALAERGFELEAVERFDFSDNPIREYREAGTPEDISYAVKAWNDQVSPGIAAGATREDFEAYDQEHGLEGHQQLAGVYDYFLGSDAIKSGGERKDGTLDVTNGRHRLEQARLNGVTHLPVRK